MAEAPHGRGDHDQKTAFHQDFFAVEEIRRLAAELFDRIVNMQSHFNEIGRSLDKSVDAYNRSVASLESRLYPTLRRIRELGATTAEEPPVPDKVNGVPRVPTLFEVS